MSILRSTRERGAHRAGSAVSLKTQRRRYPRGSCTGGGRVKECFFSRHQRITATTIADTVAGTCLDGFENTLNIVSLSHLRAPRANGVGIVFTSHPSANRTNAVGNNDLPPFFGNAGKYNERSALHPSSGIPDK